MNRILVGTLLWLACLAGCQQADPSKTTAAAAPVDQQTSADGDPDSQDSDSHDGGASTFWQACYLHGEKIGYAEVSTRRLQPPDRELLEITSHNHMSIQRFGNQNQIDIETTSVETPAGDVLRFSSTTIAGTNRVTVSGNREGDEMEIETTVAQAQSVRRMPWQSDFRGFHAVEQSLQRDPMKPGDTRSLKQLHPMLSQVVMADVQLAARDFEDTKLLAGTRRLLHIDETTVLPGGKALEVHSVIWTDPEGRAIKMTTEAAEGLEEINYRTTRKIALAESGDAKLDLGFDPIVKIQKPLPEPWKTKRVRYRVELEGEDPAKMFPTSPTQQVAPLGPHAVEILVLAPAAAPAGKAPAIDRPTPEESAPSSMIQSGDPTIVAMSNEARDGKQEPLAVAYALEKYVHTAVENKDFSQAFASALEVARSKQGDCTEHAVLLAALARASGLPARGDRTGVRHRAARLRLPHVDRSLRRQSLAAARCHAGPGRHRGQSLEAG